MTTSTVSVISKWGCGTAHFQADCCCYLPYSVLPVPHVHLFTSFKMGKVAKKAAPVAEKKAPVKKTIAKSKPEKNAVAKKPAKQGISGKYAGVREKPKKEEKAAVSLLFNCLLYCSTITNLLPLRSPRKPRR